MIHNQLALEFKQWLIADGFLFALAVLFLHRRRFGTGLLCLLVIALGASLTNWEHYRFANKNIGLFAGDQPHLATVEVRLTDDPKVMVGPPMGSRPMPPTQVALGQVLRIQGRSGWIPASGDLPIKIHQIQPELRGGQTVQMLGMIEQPRAAANPGEFDWANYYRQQRILATFVVNRPGNVLVVSDAGPSLISWLRNKTRHLLAKGFSNTRAGDYALLDAMLLGDRDPQLADIEQQFKDAGMAYQLSVSGLHIALLAAVVFWICRFLRLSPLITLLITSSFVITYASVALPSHSGIRAAILCIVGTIAICSNRSFDRAQMLGNAVVVMLVWHPMDLFSPGFHLSFAVVIVFMLLLPAIQQWQRQRQNPDEMVRRLSQKPTRSEQLREAVFAWISRMLQFSVLAWLATLPLVAYHFGAASSWAILGGLVLFPVLAFCLLLGAGKIAFTLLWPSLSATWASVAALPVQLLQCGVHLIQKLPGSSIALPAPPIWLIVVYYLLLIAPLLPYRFWVGRSRVLLRFAPLVGVIAIFFTSIFPNHSPDTSDECKITLLSLGAGQCAIIEPPGGHTVLIDAGSSTVSDVGQKLIEPFLKTEGKSQIDELFLSHGDFDHISAAAELVSALNVHRVFVSTHFKVNSEGNVPDENLLDELVRLDRTPKELVTGDHIALTNSTSIDVVWPPREPVLNSNNAGLVLRLNFAGKSILFPADIQDPAFAGVLKNAKALKSDVLIAPHHGSSEDLTPTFLSAVHPDMILSSNFGRLTNKQKRFNQMVGNTSLYRTSDYGAITLTISKEGKIKIQTYLKKLSKPANSR